MGTRKSVPDHWRKALRTGLGVGILVCIGCMSLSYLGGRTERFAMQFMQGAKWGAITVVVVAQPVLGKTMQVSTERSLGTVAGGLLGFVVVLAGRSMVDIDDLLFSGVLSFAVAFGAVLFGNYMGLDYSAKLFVMTFLLVVMGVEHASDAAIITLTRIGGILSGVVLSLVLSVTIMPKSASHQAADNLSAAMTGLINLSKLCWNEGLMSASEPTLERRTSYIRIPPSSQAALELEAGLLEQSEIDRKEAVCEKAVVDIWKKLSKAEESIPLAANEMYFLTFHGRWCFLPVLPWVRCGPSWQIPAAQMMTLAAAMRKVAATLWALHVTFQEGFDAALTNALRRRYPADMLRNLQQHSQAALQDMDESFPAFRDCDSPNLRLFVKGAQELIRISDDQRKVIMEHISQSFAQMSSEPTSRNNSYGSMRLLAETPSYAPTLPIQEESSDDVAAAGTSGDLNGGPLGLKSSLQQSSLAGEAAGPLPAGNGKMDSMGRPGNPSVPESVFASAHQGSTDDFEMIEREGEALNQGRMYSLNTSSNLGPQIDPVAEAQKLEIFPPTMAGYKSKVRWYSFQFLMVQLSEELTDMHTALCAVLRELPDADDNAMISWLKGGVDDTET